MPDDPRDDRYHHEDSVSFFERSLREALEDSVKETTKTRDKHNNEEEK